MQLIKWILVGLALWQGWDFLKNKSGQPAAGGQTTTPATPPGGGIPGIGGVSYDTGLAVYPQVIPSNLTDPVAGSPLPNLTAGVGYVYPTDVPANAPTYIAPQYNGPDTNITPTWLHGGLG